jgi:hypothetical protein
MPNDRPLARVINVRTRADFKKSIEAALLRNYNLVEATGDKPLWRITVVLFSADPLYFEDLMPILKELAESRRWFVVVFESQNSPLEDAIKRQLLNNPIEIFSFDGFVKFLELEEEGVQKPVNDSLEVVLDPNLSSEQVLQTLTALAEYYRACGGVGLPAEFQAQEAVTEEVHA